MHTAMWAKKFFARSRYPEYWSRYVSKQGPAFPEYLKRCLGIADVSDGQSLLDLGCGEGVFLEFFARKDIKNLTIIGVDISKEMLKKAELRLERAFRGHSSDYHFIVADSYFLPFQATCLDRIICLRTFFYFPHPEFVIAEACRVLKEKGIFVADARSPLHPRNILAKIRSSFTHGVHSIVNRIKVLDRWREKVSSYEKGVMKRLLDLYYEPFYTHSPKCIRNICNSTLMDVYFYGLQKNQEMADSGCFVIKATKKKNRDS